LIRSRTVVIRPSEDTSLKQTDMEKDVLYIPFNETPAELA